MIDGAKVANYWTDDDPERVYTVEEVVDCMEHAFKVGQSEAKAFVLTLLEHYNAIGLLNGFHYELIKKGIEDGL